jgi:hypothetical protein
MQTENKTNNIINKADIADAAAYVEAAEREGRRISPMNDLMAKKLFASEENKDILAGLAYDS